jgi:endogenous inhibitor of DNA gyrase (YacG/DUF329 family)
MMKKPPPAKVLKCPICREPAAPAYRPFCSRRCADIDLGRWFSGSYGVAGSDDDAGEEAIESRFSENRDLTRKS